MTETMPNGVQPIDPNRFYTVKEMQSDLRCLPWLQNYRSYLKLVKTELEGENELNVHEVKGSVKTKFVVKGADILSYVEKRLTN